MTTLDKKGMLGIITSIALAAVVFSVTLPYQESQAGAPVAVGVEIHGTAQCKDKDGVMQGSIGFEATNLLGDRDEQRMGPHCSGSDIGGVDIVHEFDTPVYADSIKVNAECDNGDKSKTVQKPVRLNKGPEVQVKGACHLPGGDSLIYELDVIVVIA